MRQANQDMELLYLEQMCAALQKKLIRTYSQFGERSGTQLRLVHPDSFFQSPDSFTRYQ